MFLLYSMAAMTGEWNPRKLDPRDIQAYREADSRKREASRPVSSVATTTEEKPVVQKRVRSRWLRRLLSRFI